MNMSSWSFAGKRFAHAKGCSAILLAALVAASCSAGEGSGATGGAGAPTSSGTGGGAGATGGSGSGGRAGGGDSGGAGGAGRGGNGGNGGNGGPNGAAGTTGTAGAGGGIGEGGSGGNGGNGGNGGSPGTSGAAGTGGSAIAGTNGAAGRGGSGGAGTAGAGGAGRGGSGPAGSGGRGGAGGTSVGGGGGAGGATGGAAGASGPFVCSQVTGGKLTEEWFIAGFENVVDNTRWQVKWREDAYVEEWANLQSGFWTAQIDSTCAKNTSAPDRLVFGTVSFKYKTQAEWRTGITQAVNNFKTTWPSVRRIDLVTQIRGPNNMLCPTAPTAGETIAVPPEQDAAMADVAAAFPGFVFVGPKVQAHACSEFQGGGPHLTAAGNMANVPVLSNYFVQVQ